MEKGYNKYDINFDKSYKNSDVNFNYKIVSLNPEEKEIIGKEKINIIIMKYLDRLDQSREFILGEFSDDKFHDLNIRDFIVSINNCFKMYGIDEKSEAEVKDEINIAIDQLRYDLEDRLGIRYTREGYNFVYSNRDNISFNSKASVIIDEDIQRDHNLSFFGHTDKIFASKEEREHLNAKFREELKEESKTTEEIVENRRDEEEAFIKKLTKTERSYLERAMKSCKIPNVDPMILEARVKIASDYLRSLHEKYEGKDVEKNPPIQPVM